MATQVPKGQKVVVAPARAYFMFVDEDVDAYLAWMLQHDWVPADGTELILVWVREPVPLGEAVTVTHGGTRSAVTAPVDKRCSRCGAVASLRGSPVIGPGRRFISCDDAFARQVLES